MMPENKPRMRNNNLKKKKKRKLIKTNNLVYNIKQKQKLHPGKVLPLFPEALKKLNIFQPSHILWRQETV